MDDIQRDGTQHNKFRTFIIDAWYETSKSSQQVIWRFRVRDVRTEDQKTFVSTDSLLAYLQSEFNINPTNE